MKHSVIYIITALMLLSFKGLKSQEMKTEEEIILAVSSIFEATDARNWEKVQQAFASTVLLDYTSMAGGQPVKLTPVQITDNWRGILPGFDKTRHMVSHFEVSLNDETATVTHFGTANHHLGKETWTVVGNYEHQLIKKSGVWKVSSMKFNLEFIDGNTDLPRLAKEVVEGKIIDHKEVVDRFFVALETQEFEILNEIFSEDARQLNPYIPEGFPKSFDGRDGIFKQYSGLTENFGQMKFPRTIYVTEDPNTVFVKFRGEIEIKAGGKYENDYLGIFKLDSGKIVEYTEFFNPIVMAKAFGIQLK